MALFKKGPFFWRSARVAEWGGLENRCAFCVPWVRIPPSPPFYLAQPAHPWKTYTYRGTPLENNFFNIIPNISDRIIFQNDLIMCFPAQMPIVSGHILVSPVRPVKYFDDLTQSEKLALFDMVDVLKKALKASFGAEGFNFAWNEEKIAGQSVDHFHLHILPRKHGDAGITQYEPRDFLYRNTPVELRPESPKEELQDIARIIRENLNI